MFEDSILRNILKHPWLLVPWILFGLPIAMGILLAFLDLWWLLLILLAAPILFFGLKEVPASEPASVAVLTIWGKPVEIMLSPGIWLLAPYLPFLIDLIIVDIENQNLDLTFPDIRCRLDPRKKSGESKKPVNAASGGEVEVDVSLTIIPRQDPRALVSYIKAGGLTSSTSQTPETRTRLHDQLRDLVGETVRREGAQRTWEQMTFAQVKLAALLVRRTTGEKVTAEESDPDFDEKCAGELEEMLKNGKADIHDLGLIIRRLNVVRVLPAGELRADAELAAREQQQAVKQRIEQRFRRNEAKKIVAAAKEAGDETMTFERALQLLRIEEGKTPEKVVDVRSSGNSIVDAAGLVNDGLDGVGR